MAEPRPSSVPAAKVSVGRVVAPGQAAAAEAWMPRVTRSVVRREAVVAQVELQVAAAERVVAKEREVAGEQQAAEERGAVGAPAATAEPGETRARAAAEEQAEAAALEERRRARAEWTRARVEPQAALRMQAQSHLQGVRSVAGSRFSTSVGKMAAGR